MKQRNRLFPRLMAVFLLAVFLTGLLPTGVLAMGTEESPDPSATPTAPAETTAPTEAASPTDTPVTEPPAATEAPLATESIEPSGDTSPDPSDDAATEPSESTTFPDSSEDDGTPLAETEPERELIHGFLGGCAQNMESMAFYSSIVVPNFESFDKYTGWHYLDDDDDESNNGYSASSPYMRTLYCINPGLPFGANPSGSNYYVNLMLTDEKDFGSSTLWTDTPFREWSKMSYDVRRAIALTMFYGCPHELWDAEAGLNECDNTLDKANDNPNIGYRFATQTLIREFVTGYRSPVYPYELKVSNNYWAMFMPGQCMSPDGTIDYTLEGYNYILSRLLAHEKPTVLPSFTASTVDTAPEYVIEGNTLTLEDTNNVLRYFTFTDNSDVTIKRDGNKLTVIASEDCTEVVIHGYWLKPNPEESTYTVVGYSPNAQSTVTITSKKFTKVNCYFKLKVEKPTGTVTLAKSINASDACIEQIQGNPLYSLAGAEYGVYLDDGTLQEILVTDATGHAASTMEYEVGTILYIKEISAPPGFILDTATYELTVTSGSNTVAVKDKPIFDPPFSMTKVDSATGNPQGDSSFSGAVFKWEFFPNYDWSGAVERTWYFATNSAGWVQYLPSYFANGYSSDALYVNDDGANEIPLGSVKITEVKNSLGYIVLPEPLYCTITQTSSGSETAAVVWTEESLKYLSNIAAGNYGVLEPQDSETFGGFTLSKKDSVTGDTPQGSAALAGARFQVINNSANSVKIGSFPEAAPGEVCYEFTVGADGTHNTGNIFPIGCYTIQEVSAPVGYELNTTWSESFIVSNGEHEEFTCENKVFKGGLKLIKYDMDLGKETGSDAPLDGITFSLINNSDNPVMVNGVSYAKGETVMILAIQWDGNAWTATTGADILPYGKYIIQENPMQPGSSMANKDYYLNTEPQEIEIDRDGKLVTVQFDNKFKVIPGKVTIYKTDLIGRPLAGAKILLEWSEDGKHWQPVEYSSLERPYKGSCGTKGLKDGCLTTGSDGIVVFENLYVGLYYRVTELEAPEGYILLTDFAYEGKLTKTEPDAEISIINTQGYTLPGTGCNSATVCGALGAMMTLALMLTFLPIFNSRRTVNKNYYTKERN